MGSHYLVEGQLNFAHCGTLSQHERHHVAFFSPFNLKGLNRQNTSENQLLVRRPRHLKGFEFAFASSAYAVPNAVL